MKDDPKPEPWRGVTAAPVSPAEWVLSPPWTTPDTESSHTYHPDPQEEKPMPEDQPEIVIVVELTEAELANAWTEDLFVPPADQDVFVRCQKIVIAYCTYYTPTINRTTYTREYAHQQARRIARPLAALAARIPLTKAELSEHAFHIHDAIASWAPPDDAAAHAVAAVFEAYALPRERADYRDVKV